jgi:glycerate dehydrogenase
VVTGIATATPIRLRPQTLERIRHAEVVVSNKVVLDRHSLAGAAHLKLVCIAGTG